MNQNDKNILRATERFLYDSEKYREILKDGHRVDCTVGYILVNPKAERPNQVIGFADNEGDILIIQPFSQEKPDYFIGHTFDRQLFAYLEAGYRLAYMDKDTHYCVWNDLEETTDGDFFHQTGVQKYLDYCKRNGITRDSIEYEGMDVLQHYDPKIARSPKSKEQER